MRARSTYTQLGEICSGRVSIHPPGDDFLTGHVARPWPYVDREHAP